MSWDRRASPSITGTIADSPSLNGRPAALRPALKYFVFSSRRSRSSVLSSSILNTSSAAPTMLGARELEKR